MTAKTTTPAPKSAPTTPAKAPAKSGPKHKASKPPSNPFLTQHPASAGRSSSTRTTPRGSR